MNSILKRSEVTGLSTPGNGDRICLTWRRSGFSLLELMLVLAIVAAIGAIAAPMLIDSFERAKLNGSAGSLRLDFDRTRLKAMETGQIQVFKCTLGERDFTIEPWMTSGDTANASAGATLISGAGTLVETQSNGMIAAADANALAGDAKQLDENVSFVSCLVSSDMRSFSIGQQMGGITGAAMTSQLILFYPDGSTSTAEVIVQNKRGDMRAVSLRGLTGMSRVTVKQNVPTQTP